MTPLQGATLPKILLASHHASRRGSAISLLELGVRLPAAGYEPVFVFSKPGPLVEELRARSFTVHLLRREGWLRWPLLRATYDLIRHEDIALAHVNSAVPFSKYIALAARWAGIPVVWHVREPVTDKRMCRQRWWIRHLADRIIVLTQEQAHFFSRPNKTRRIFNGVDLEKFRRTSPIEAAKQALGVSPEDFLFVHIGSIEANKGQLRALHAFAALLAQSPRIRLFFAGEITETAEMEALREMLARDASLASAVTILGPQNDIAPLLWAADCLLLPSRQESFPRTVMEAMAAGVPVIASRVGALPDMVLEGENGWLVPADDHPALVLAMTEALRFVSGKRRHFIERCVALAEERFSISAHIAAITRLYAEVLSSRSHR